MKYLVFILIFFINTNSSSQTKRDPRVVGMAGAYTTIANGIFSIGYNPGLIGLQQNDPMMIQGLQLDFGILGNFFSIENIAQYSGDTLDTKEKNKLFFSAKLANSFPCLATSALFAVITDLLLFRAEKQRSFAIPSSPPISSMITLISSDLLIKMASSKNGIFEKSVFLFLLLDFAEIPHSLITNNLF